MITGPHRQLEYTSRMTIRQNKEGAIMVMT